MPRRPLVESIPMAIGRLLQQFRVFQNPAKIRSYHPRPPGMSDRSSCTHPNCEPRYHQQCSLEAITLQGRISKLPNVFTVPRVLQRQYLSFAWAAVFNTCITMKIFAFIVYSITNVSNVRNIGLPHEFLVLTELVEFFLINPAETNFFFSG